MSEQSPPSESEGQLDELRRLLDERRRLIFARVPFDDQLARAVVHIDRARLLLFEGQVEAALVELEHALRAKPDCGEAWLLCGKAHEHLGRFKDALRCVETAQSIDPALPNIEYKLANARERAGLPRYVLESPAPRAKRASRWWLSP